MKQDHFNQFTQDLRNASTDKRAEKAVRYMLEEVAKDCPMGVLLRLGQCLADCRRTEIRDEVSRN